MPPAATSSRRRQARLRREYLYRKSLEGQDRHEYEQKRLVRKALAEGKALPTEVRASYDGLQRELTLEDDRTSAVHTHVDDEYANAGLLEPRVCVTTSRDPSSRLMQFAKEVKLLFPNSTRINRGNNRIADLMEACRQQSDVTDLVMLQETRGEPDGLVICHLPLGPTAFFTISNAVLRHDIEDAARMSEAYPHLILHNFTTDLGKRLGNIWKCLFPIPKADSQRVLTLANHDDSISFRHHMYNKTNNNKKVELHEVGPRFELKLYQIRLGTLEQSEADNEYVLRPYQNTAKKRRIL